MGFLLRLHVHSVVTKEAVWELIGEKGKEGDRKVFELRLKMIATEIMQKSDTF